MTPLPRIAAALGLLLAAPAAFAHETAASGGGVGMLPLLLGAAVVALGLWARSSVRTRLLRNLRRWRLV